MCLGAVLMDVHSNLAKQDISNKKPNLNVIFDAKLVK